MSVKPGHLSLVPFFEEEQPDFRFFMGDFDCFFIATKDLKWVSTATRTRRAMQRVSGHSKSTSYFDIGSYWRRDPSGTILTCKALYTVFKENPSEHMRLEECAHMDYTHKIMERVQEKEPRWMYDPVEYNHSVREVDQQRFYKKWYVIWD